MSLLRLQSVGRFALGLSTLTFAVFFLNVLVGGPLHKKPWMSDVWEMLTLFVAVIFFVVGTICREAESNSRRNSDGQTTGESRNKNP